MKQQKQQVDCLAEGSHVEVGRRLGSNIKKSVLGLCVLGCFTASAVNAQVPDPRLPEIAKELFKPAQLDDTQKQERYLLQQIRLELKGLMLLAEQHVQNQQLLINEATLEKNAASTDEAVLTHLQSEALTQRRTMQAQNDKMTSLLTALQNLRPEIDFTMFQQRLTQLNRAVSDLSNPAVQLSGESINATQKNRLSKANNLLQLSRNFYAPMNAKAPDEPEKAFTSTTGKQALPGEDINAVIPKSMGVISDSSQLPAYARDMGQDINGN